MRYFAVVLLLFSLPFVSHAAKQMSPAVKAHLCKLAKRDAALSPEEAAAIRRRREECLAAAPTELGPAVTKCTSTKWGYSVNTKCTTTQPVIPKHCPKDYAATAEKRIAEYCTDE